METVFEAWRTQLDDADAFREPGTTVRVRTEGHDDSVSVVVLFDRVLVSVFCAPPQSVRAALENHQPPEALAEETTVARLVGPIERTLGPAVLGYLDGAPPRRIQAASSPSTATTPACSPWPSAAVLKKPPRATSARGPRRCGCSPRAA